MSKLQTVSCIEFLSIVENAIAGRFSSLRVYNAVSLTGGKACPFYGATKSQLVNGRLGDAYRKLLERSLKRDGIVANSVIVGERSWGESCGKNLLVHTDKAGNKMVYVVFVGIGYSQTVYYHNDVVINADAIKPYFPATKPTTVNFVADGMTRSEKIKLAGKFSNYRLDSITSFSINKKEYILDKKDLCDAIALF